MQQRVLGLLFGQPDRRFQSAELIRLAKGGVGAVHRQLSRLAASDLLTVTRTGNQKHYQARRDSPVFEELHGLIVKTVGVAAPLREALAPRAGAMTAAQWRAKRARTDSFAARVAAGPRVFVVGSEDDLG